METTVYMLDFERAWVTCKRNERATGISSDRFYQNYYAGKYVVTPEAQRWVTCYELMMDRLPKHSTEGVSDHLLIPA